MDQFEINNGSSAVFQCEASAVPEHNVFWTFTNSSGSTRAIISTTESDTDNYQIKRVRGIGAGFGELTVLDVQYEDRGRYTCTAVNSLGADISNANLTVHGELLKFCCNFSFEVGYTVHTSTLFPASLSPSFFYLFTHFLIPPL